MYIFCFSKKKKQHSSAVSFVSILFSSCLTPTFLLLLLHLILLYKTYRYIFSEISNYHRTRKYRERERGKFACWFVIVVEIFLTFFQLYYLLLLFFFDHRNKKWKRIKSNDKLNSASCKKLRIFMNM